MIYAKIQIHGLTLYYIQVKSIEKMILLTNKLQAKMTPMASTSARLNKKASEQSKTSANPPWDWSMYSHRHQIQHHTPQVPY